MKKIGITGEHGFVGAHLRNWLSLQPDMEVVPFVRDWLEDKVALALWVAQCDVVVHLAALNRHIDPQVIYNTNISLVQRLIDACETANEQPHILFSSSTQESLDNPYGQSKKEGAHLFHQWAEKSGAKVSHLVIPNVFGPFGRPQYNSVVATFCHKIANGETPVILQDSILNLVYINELVGDIAELIRTEQTGRIEIASRHTLAVSALKDKLEQYRALYMEQDQFPDLQLPIDLALFNTFRCYIPHTHYPRPFKLNTDTRGTFVEVARTHTPGQFSYSTTVPGITRGNHFHTRKAERFAVIGGQAVIRLRKIDSEEIIEYHLSGESPCFVDMPIWHVHNITNIGQGELLTLFWINEPFDPTNPDTYFVEV